MNSETKTTGCAMGVGCRVASRMAGVRAYRPPAADPRVDLWLDANEGPALDGGAMEALGGLSPDVLRRYPDAGALERLIAERHGIEPARVVVTNGGDDAIDRMCRVTLEPGRVLVQHAPSFAMIEHSARLAGARVVGVPWFGGAFPLEALVERISDETGLVALVSPNNPTGGVIETGDLLRVVDAAGGAGSDGVGAAVLVDLAYVEFADVDPTRVLLDRPDVVMVRTLSKAFGMAGLRVGYAIAPAGMAELLRAAGGPYPVSGVSLAVAAAALERGDARRGAIERVRGERARLIERVPKIGFEALASQANFVLMRCVDAARVHAALLERGISVRAFPSNPVLRDALRITLPGDAAAFDRLLAALREIASEMRSPMEPTP